MRPSQSQGFRLHFGQHDKAAAGRGRGSVSVRKPSTRTRAAQIQLRREEGGGGLVAAPSPALWSAPPPPPGLRSGPPSPVQSRSSRAAARRRRKRAESEDRVRAPRSGSARPQLPGARMRGRPSSRRAEEPAVELLTLPPPRRCRCRCSRTAWRGRPPPSLRRAPLGSGRVSVSRALWPHSPLRPFPVSASLRSLQAWS